MKKIVWIAAAIVIVGGGVWAASSYMNRQGSRTGKDTADAMKRNDVTAVMCAQDAKICPDGSAVERTGPNCEFAACPGGVMMEKQPGAYADYSSAALAEATKNGGKTVIFFHASWCAECKKDNADIASNPDKIPAGITILKADYDTEKALKQKYGVTYQNTFVQIDQNGGQVTKWINGGRGLENILKQIK